MSAQTDRQSAREALEVLRRYVAQDQIGRLLQELCQVGGNQSFTYCARVLRHEWESRQ